MSRRQFPLRLWASTLVFMEMEKEMERWAGIHSTQKFLPSCHDNDDSSLDYVKNAALVEGSQRQRGIYKAIMTAF